MPSRETKGRYTEKFKPEDFEKILATNMPKTTAYIAKQIGCERRTALKYLMRLMDEKKAVGFDIDDGGMKCWIPEIEGYTPEVAAECEVKCEYCGGPALDFRNKDANTKYHESGKCQACQDKEVSNETITTEAYKLVKSEYEKSLKELEAAISKLHDGLQKRIEEIEKQKVGKHENDSINP